MKQLHFLLFISGLTLAFSLTEFYKESGENEGVDIWEMNKVSYR